MEILIAGHQSTDMNIHSTALSFARMASCILPARVLHVEIEAVLDLLREQVSSERLFCSPALPSDLHSSYDPKNELVQSHSQTWGVTLSSGVQGFSGAGDSSRV